MPSLADCMSAIRQIENLRYESVAASGKSSAEFYSAVPQSCTLPGVGRPQRPGSPLRLADYKSAIRQIENLRYESVAASGRSSAEFYSAVPQSCTLPGVGRPQRPGSPLRLADYKSAIRQIENLRYKNGTRGET